MLQNIHAVFTVADYCCYAGFTAPSKLHDKSLVTEPDFEITKSALQAVLDTVCLHGDSQLSSCFRNNWLSHISQAPSSTHSRCRLQAVLLYQLETDIGPYFCCFEVVQLELSIFGWLSGFNSFNWFWNLALFRKRLQSLGHYHNETATSNRDPNSKESRQQSISTTYIL